MGDYQDIYNEISKQYNIGGYDEWAEAMKDPSRRKKFYGLIQDGGFGTWEQFNANFTPADSSEVMNKAEAMKSSAKKATIPGVERKNQAHSFSRVGSRSVNSGPIVSSNGRQFQSPSQFTQGQKEQANSRRLNQFMQGQPVYMQGVGQKQPEIGQSMPSFESQAEQNVFGGQQQAQSQASTQYDINKEFTKRAGKWTYDEEKDIKVKTGTWTAVDEMQEQINKQAPEDVLNEIIRDEARTTTQKDYGKMVENVTNRFFDAESENIRDLVIQNLGLGQNGVANPDASEGKLSKEEQEEFNRLYANELNAISTKLQDTIASKIEEEYKKNNPVSGWQYVYDQIRHNTFVGQMLDVVKKYIFNDPQLAYQIRQDMYAKAEGKENEGETWTAAKQLASPLRVGETLYEGATGADNKIPYWARLASSVGTLATDIYTGGFTLGNLATKGVESVAARTLLRFAPKAAERATILGAAESTLKGAGKRMLAERAAVAALPKVGQTAYKIGKGMAGSSANMAAYSAQSAILQQANSGEWNVGDIMTASAEGAGTGVILGVGGLVSRALPNRGIFKYEPVRFGSGVAINLAAFNAPKTIEALANGASFRDVAEEAGIDLGVVLMLETKGWNQAHKQDRLEREAYKKAHGGEEPPKYVDTQIGADTPITEGDIYAIHQSAHSEALEEAIARGGDINKVIDTIIADESVPLRTRQNLARYKGTPRGQLPKGNDLAETRTEVREVEIDGKMQNVYVNAEYDADGNVLGYSLYKTAAEAEQGKNLNAIGVYNMNMVYAEYDDASAEMRSASALSDFWDSLSAEEQVLYNEYQTERARTLKARYEEIDRENISEDAKASKRLREREELDKEFSKDGRYAGVVAKANGFFARRRAEVGEQKDAELKGIREQMKSEGMDVDAVLAKKDLNSFTTEDIAIMKEYHDRVMEYFADRGMSRAYNDTILNGEDEGIIEDFSVLRDSQKDVEAANRLNINLTPIDEAIRKRDGKTLNEIIKSLNLSEEEQVILGRYIGAKAKQKGFDAFRERMINNLVADEVASVRPVVNANGRFMQGKIRYKSGQYEMGENGEPAIFYLRPTNSDMWIILDAKGNAIGETLASNVVDVIELTPEEYGESQRTTISRVFDKQAQWTRSHNANTQEPRVGIVVDTPYGKRVISAQNPDGNFVLAVFEDGVDEMGQPVRRYSGVAETYSANDVIRLQDTFYDKVLGEQRMEQEVGNASQREGVNEEPINQPINQPNNQPKEYKEGDKVKVEGIEVKVLKDDGNEVDVESASGARFTVRKEEIEDIQPEETPTPKAEQEPQAPQAELPMENGKIAWHKLPVDKAIEELTNRTGGSTERVQQVAMAQYERADGNYAAKRKEVDDLDSQIESKKKEIASKKAEPEENIDLSNLESVEDMLDAVGNTKKQTELAKLNEDLNRLYEQRNKAADELNDLESKKDFWEEVANDETFAGGAEMAARNKADMEHNREAEQNGGLIRSNLTDKLAPTTQRLIEEMGKALGKPIKVEMFAQDMRGVNNPGDDLLINFHTLDREAGGKDYVARTILGHELTHELKWRLNATEAEPIWSAYVQAVKDAMGEEIFNSKAQGKYDVYVQTLKDAEKALEEGTAIDVSKKKVLDWIKDNNTTIEDYCKDIVEEEVAADYAGENILTDKMFVTRLTERVAANTEQPKTFIDRVVKKIDDLMNVIRPLAMEGDEDAMAEYDALQAAKDIWGGMYEVAAKMQSANADIAEQNGGARLSLVTDKEELKMLEEGETIQAYRSVRVDKEGNINPTMATGLNKIGDTKGTKIIQEKSAQMNEWDKAEEHPELVDENGMIEIRKEDPDNKGSKTTKVAYDPYIHLREGMMNDQFKSGWERDNIRIAKALIPKSEIEGENPYHAEKAKLAVGKHPWKKGAVSEKLPEGRKTDVYLSRWAKTTEFVPDEEVAQNWISNLEGTGIEVPFNVVPKAILKMLDDAGVKIVEPETSMGERCRKAYDAWKADKQDYYDNWEYGDRARNKTVGTTESDAQTAKEFADDAADLRTQAETSRVQDLATSLQEQAKAEGNVIERARLKKRAKFVDDVAKDMMLSKDGGVTEEDAERLIPNESARKSLEEKTKDSVSGASTEVSGNAGNIRFSFVGNMEGCGFEASAINENNVKQPMVDKDGNVYVRMGERVFDGSHPIKEEDLRGAKNSALNYMIKDCLDLKFVTPEGADNIYKAMTSMLNAYLDKGQAKNGGAEQLVKDWQFVGETVYKTLASNGDSQYAVSSDITRVCKKNEAIIRTISEMQKRLRYGITPAQILDIYLTTDAEGYQVPCPVCYVFSRYIRNGSIASAAINGMRRYGKHLKGQPKEWTPKQWENELKKLEEYNNQKEVGNALERAKADVTVILSTIDALSKEVIGGKLTAREKKEKIKQIEALDKRYRAALNVISQQSLTNWIKSFAIHSVNGKMELYEDSPLPRDMKDFENNALDLRLTANTMVNYPSIQRLRKSKGSAGGKEITFEANNDLGDVIVPLAHSGSPESAVNYYREAALATDAKEKEKLLKSAKSDLVKAYEFAQRQALRGGIRMWSWSDNIEKLAPDVAVNLMQWSLINGSLQSYSKQLEGINLVARMGGYVNGSLMGRGIGYKEVTDADVIKRDGKKYLSHDITFHDAKRNADIVGANEGTPIYEEGGKMYALMFDDVTGIQAFDQIGKDGKVKKGLFSLNKELDKAGNILVGMNDLHIKAAMADNRVLFIIPWHSSGQSVHILKQMLTYLGVDLKEFTPLDYTDMQEEKDYGVTDKDGVYTEIPQRLVDLWEKHKNETDFKCGIEGGIKSGENGRLSESQKHYRELRDAIMTGVRVDTGRTDRKSGKPIYETKLVEDAHPEWMEEIKNDAFLKQLFDAIRDRVPSKMMTNGDKKYIYPYEYWDTKSTLGNADINGERYIEYCRRLGYKPKFSGRWKGNQDINEGDFTETPGYWKVLIDRRMYDTKGRYQGLTITSAKDFDPAYVDPIKTAQEFITTKVADEEGVRRITDKTLEMEKGRYEDTSIDDLPSVDYSTSLKKAIKKYNDVASKVKVEPVADLKTIEDNPEPPTPRGKKADSAPKLSLTTGDAAEDEKLGKALYRINKAAKELRDVNKGYGWNKDLFDVLKTLGYIDESAELEGDRIGYRDALYDRLWYNTEEVKAELNDAEYDLAKAEERGDKEEISDTKEYIDSLNEILAKLEEGKDSNIIYNKSLIEDAKKKLYDAKESVLSHLESTGTPDATHRFPMGDVRRMYTLGGYEFHGEDISDEMSDEAYRNTPTIGEISSNNRLAQDIEINNAWEEVNSYIQSTRGKKTADAAKFSFIGESGAKNLDAADGGTRIADLATAEQMEREGKEPIDIKKATGWERGVDYKWRYETEGLKFKADALTKRWGGKTTLADIVEDHDVFKAYPELKDIKVKRESSSDSLGSYNGKTNTLTVGTKYLTQWENYLKRIQEDIGTYRADDDYLNRKKKDAQEKIAWWKGRVVNTLNHEIQHTIQKRAGFARGGNVKEVELAKDFEELEPNVKLMLKIFRGVGWDLLRRLGRRNAIDVVEKYIAKAEPGKLRTEDAKALRRELIYMDDAEFNAIIGQAKANEPRILEQAKEGYHNLAGEVEARNAGRRAAEDYDSLRGMLATDTEDVARENQILRGVADPLSQFGLRSKEVNNEPPKFSLSDDAYKKAVESGDEEVAGRMVKEAAKDAMPKTKVVDENGEPLVMVHNTNNDFTTFDRGRIGTGQGQAFLGLGFNFSRGGSSAYGNKEMRVYLDARNPLESTSHKLTRNQLEQVIRNLDKTSEDRIEDNWGSMKRALDALTDVDDMEAYATIGMMYYGDKSNVIEEFKKLGYDSTIEYNNYDGKIRNAVVFDPNQIKSADPITYDDNGKAIPLSKRFDNNDGDIRFSLADDATAKVQSEVIESIREQLDREDLKAMHKGNLQSLLYDVKNVNEENLDEVLGKARRTVYEVKSRGMNREITNMLNLKTTDKNGRGIRIGKVVDNDTRKIMGEVKDYLGELMATEYDERISELNRELRSGVDDVRKAEINAELAELKADREAVRAGNRVDAKLDIEQALAELDDKMQEAAATAAGIPGAKGTTWAREDTNHEIALGILKDRLKTANIQHDIAQLQRDLNGEEGKRKDAYTRYQSGEITYEQYRNFAEGIKGSKAAINALLNEAYGNLYNSNKALHDKLAGLVEGGRENFKLNVEREIEHKIDLMRGAFGDIRTNKRYEEIKKQRGLFAKNPDSQTWAKALFISPLDSFEYICQAVAQNSLGKDSFLYKHFIEGENGVLAARNKFIEGVREKTGQLDAKSKEIYGKGFDDAANQNAKYFAKTDVYIINDNAMGGREEIGMTKAQGMYIYMAWKMKDGRSKLALQGFDEESIEDIKLFIGAKNIEFADWLQEEFLTSSREKYNKKYLEIFGTEMAKIENYVPLKIDKSSIDKESNLINGDQAGSVNIQRKAGALIERRVNTRPIDLTTSAFEVIADHVNEMEQWTAYADVRKDIDYLLRSHSFRNQLNANTSGMYNRFRAAAEVAVEASPKQSRDGVEKAIPMLTKGIVAGNIAYRYTTAMKQILSVPAFLGYSQDPRFLYHFTKNMVGDYVGSIPGVVGNMATFGAFDKQIFKNAYEGKGYLTNGIAKSVGWCMRELPDFYDRVLKGAAGDNILEEKSLNNLIGKALDGYAEKGMSANKMIDAITCAIGVKSIFDYKYDKLIRAGVEKGKAKRQALTEASIYYNGTQQASQPAYLSAMQSGHTVLEKAFTVYQNANIGYARKAAEACQDIARVWKKSTFEKYAERYMKEDSGLSHADAIKKAKKYLWNEHKKDWFDVVLYGYALNRIWDIGGKGIIGAFTGMALNEMLTGVNPDDDDTPEAKKWAYLLSIPFRGMTGMNIVSTYAQGQEMNPLLFFAELDNRLDEVQKIAEEDGTLSPEMLMLALGRVGRVSGIDPKTWTNFYLGAVNMVRDIDRSTRGEEDTHYLMDILLLMNTPESNRKDVAMRYYKDRPWDEYFRDVLFASKYLVDSGDSDPLSKFGLIGNELTAQRKKKLINQMLFGHSYTDEDDMRILDEFFDKTDDSSLKKEIASMYESRYKSRQPKAEDKKEKNLEVWESMYYGYATGEDIAQEQKLKELKGKFKEGVSLKEKADEAINLRKKMEGGDPEENIKKIREARKAVIKALEQAVKEGKGVR